MKTLLITSLSRSTLQCISISGVSRRLAFNDPRKNCWPTRKPMQADKSNPFNGNNHASGRTRKNYFYSRISMRAQKKICLQEKWISNVKHKYDLRKMGQQAAITTEESSFYWKPFVMLPGPPIEAKFILLSADIYVTSSSIWRKNCGAKPINRATMFLAIDLLSIKKPFKWIISAFHASRQTRW